MTLKFNDTLVQVGIVASFAASLGTTTSIKLYPASVPMPSTGALITASPGGGNGPPGHLWAGSSMSISQTGGKLSLAGPAQSYSAVATGTVAWAWVFNPNAQIPFFVTDSISVTDPTAVIQVNTLSAVSGAPLVLTAFSFTFAGV